MEIKRSKGVTIMAILIIIGSIWQGLGFLNIRAMKMVLAPWPGIVRSWIIMLTFIVLLCGIIGALACFALKNWGRKLVLFSAFFNLLSYALVAPFTIFPNTRNFLEMQAREQANQLGVTFESLFIPMWATTIATYAADFVFAFLVIHFFTRITIRNQFCPEERI